MSVMESGMVEAVEGFFSEVKSRAAARTAAKQEQENARKKEVMNMVTAKEEGQNDAVKSAERATHVEKPMAKQEVPNTTAKPVKREEEDEAISITGARTQAYGSQVKNGPLSPFAVS